MSKTHPDDLLQAFREASKHYSDASILMHEAIARQAGRSGTDHKYLGILMEKGTLTAGELSHLTGLTTGAVTGLIDRLEKKKLARRQFDPGDRRKVIIVADKDEAMKLLGPVFGELQRRTSDLAGSFSAADLQLIIRYFTAATSLMHEMAEAINTQNK